MHTTCKTRGSEELGDPTIDAYFHWFDSSVHNKAAAFGEFYFPSSTFPKTVSQDFSKSL